MRTLTFIILFLIPIVPLKALVTDTIVDPRDGQVYNIVKIGNQWWMAENLKSTQYSDGNLLIDGTGVGDITGDDTTKYYFWLEDDSASYAETYGALYTWAAAMNGETSSDANPSGVQGVCPNGWHLPSDAEWKELEMFLGMSQEEADMEGFRGTDEGGKLKGTTHWENPNTGATNSSGFTALPADVRNLDGDTDGGGVTAVFWSSAESDSSNAWLRFIENVYAEVSRFNYYKGAGASVRCLKDKLNLPPVADAGEDQQVNEGDSVTLDGSGSYDPSSGTLSYKWTADSAIVLNDSSSLTPAFIAPEVEQDSFFRFFLVVNNGSIDSEPDTVVITVLDVNKIPVITGQMQISTDEEVPVTLSVTDLVIEDPDNSFPDDFTLIVGDGDHFTISELEVTPEQDFTGTLEIQVTVNDGRDESEPYPLAVTVYNVNDPPYFTLFPADTTIDKNSSTLLNIKAADADPGDMLSISVSFDPGISQYDLTETGNGEAELTVVPGTGDQDPVTVNVTLTDNIIAMPVEQIFTIGFSPTGLKVPGSTDPVSVYFDQASGRYYLRNNLSQLIKIEFIRITGSIILKTVLHSGQEAGISLPGDPHGIYLLRFTGTSVSGTRKVLLE